MSDYRPSDFYKYFGKEFNQKLGFVDKDDFYDNLDVIKCFGELDVSSIIEYQDAAENIICTAHLELSQSGISRRSWYELPEDTYKGNGRIRHEMFNITVGPLLNIKVMSFQSTEIGKDDLTNNNVGGLNHFEILIFKNSDIIGGVPFERILLNDVSKDDKFYLGQNERARFNILDDFMSGSRSNSSLEKHKESIEILSNIYKLMSCRFNTEFRYAVEALIKYKNKFLVCKRQINLKVAPGIWNVPAGKVKENEGIEEALIREVKEETNLDIKNVEYVDYHFINKQHKRIVFTYFTELTDISDFKLDKEEFSEFKWISAEEVDELDSLSEYLKANIKKLGISL